jgi:hypothetical protein
MPETYLSGRVRQNRGGSRRQQQPPCRISWGPPLLVDTVVASSFCTPQAPRPGAPGRCPDNARLPCTSLAKASRTGHDLSLREKPADSSEKNQPIPERKISVCPIVKVVFPGLTSNIGTLLNDKCGVLDRRRQRLSLLARRHRTHILLPVRYQYGSWTHNLSLDPPYAGGTPDPPRVATRSHDSGRACPTGADDRTRR